MALKVINEPGNEISCIVFDHDDTISPTEELKAKLTRETLLRLGVSAEEFDLSTEYLMENMGGTDRRTNQLWVQSEYGVDLDTYSHMRVTSEEDAIRNKTFKPYDGIEEIFTLLEESNFPCAIASQGHAKRILLTIENVYPEIISQALKGRIFTIDSIEGLKPKPSPDLFLHAAKELGYEPKNVLIIEDSEKGVQAAVNSGAQVMWFRNKARSLSEKLQKLVNYISDSHFDDTLEFIRKVVSKTRS